MAQHPSLVRLLGPFAVMMVVVVTVCGTVIYWAGQRTVHLQQIQNLDRLATLVRQWLDPAGQVQEPDQLDQVRRAAEVLDTRITLIDGGGRVILDTEGDAERMENHNARPEVRDARHGRVGTSSRYSSTIQQDAIYVAQLLDPGRPEGVVVRLSYPRSVWPRFAAPAWSIVGAGVVSALLVMGWLALLLQRQWIGPVRALGSAAARMAAGAWQTRVEPRGAAELKFFSHQLNVVAAHAQQQLADLDAQRSDLRALVDALPDPILLTDASRRIVLINAPAARLLQVPQSQAPGRPLLEVVDDEAVIMLLESLHHQPGDTQQRELRFARRGGGGQRLIFHAVATRTRAGGTLLVLRNISTMAAAVQMKTDFVANASHELRTPIAAIKIAFETLQDVYGEDPEQGARCIAVIDGHLRRLEEMLSDLLDLSRVESADIQPNLAPVGAAELLAVVRHSMGPVARQKGVELVLRHGGDLLHFESDRRLLDLILKNLVENSIKYTPAGGRVTVTVSEGEVEGGGGEARAAVVLEVQDTGIGIPPEHLERVFERFYQADPARSGSAGRGTGLGLAIVKHAINALGGEVDLKSTVGAGTTVRCTLPLHAPLLAAPGAAAAGAVPPEAQRVSSSG